MNNSLSVLVVWLAGLVLSTVSFFFILRGDWLVCLSFWLAGADLILLARLWNKIIQEDEDGDFG